MNITYELFLDAFCEVRTQDSEMFNYFMHEGVLKYQYRVGPKKTWIDGQTLEVIPNWYTTFQCTDPAQLIKQLEHRATLYDLAITAYLKVYGQ